MTDQFYLREHNKENWHLFIVKYNNCLGNHHFEKPEMEAALPRSQIDRSITGRFGWYSNSAAVNKLAR